MEARDARPLAAALLVFAAAVAAVWLRLPALPYAVEKVEIHVLSLVAWWRSGVVPYLPLDRLPFLQNPYGPLFEGLMAHLPAGPTPYFMGRLLSIAATATTLVLVGRRVARRTGRPALGLVAALLPLTTKPILIFAPLYRVDSLGLLLAVAGFLLATAGRPRLGAAGVAFLLAFLVKMTFVAAPLAVVVLLARDDRRRALCFGVAVGTAWVVAVGLLELATGGAYLASAASGNLPTAFGKSLELPLRLLLAGGWLVALGTCGRPALASPAAFYAATALAVAAAFAANPLSSWNYLMETTVALGLWTGDALGTADRRWPLRWLAAHVAASAVLAAGWLAAWERRVGEHRYAYEAALAALDPHATALPPASAAQADALNTLGSLPLVAAPDALARTPFVASLVAREIASRP